MQVFEKYTWDRLFGDWANTTFTDRTISFCDALCNIAPLADGTGEIAEIKTNCRLLLRIMPTPEIEVLVRFINIAQ
jgi:hypothetical protein